MAWIEDPPHKPNRKKPNETQCLRCRRQLLIPENEVLLFSREWYRFVCPACLRRCVSGVLTGWAVGCAAAEAVRGWPSTWGAQAAGGDAPPDTEEVGRNLNRLFRDLFYHHKHRDRTALVYELLEDDEGFILSIRKSTRKRADADDPKRIAVDDAEEDDDDDIDDSEEPEAPKRQPSTSRR